MNNDPSALAGTDPILSFNGHHIRTVMLDGVPWFALEDVADALGYCRDYVETIVSRPDFPEHAFRTCSEETDEGYQDATLISPVGAWWFTMLTDPARGQKFAAWSRREAKRLCPSPREGDPAVFLTLGGPRLRPGQISTCSVELPPRPLRYSGRLFEWEELRFSGEYMNRRTLYAVPSHRPALEAAN